MKPVPKAFQITLNKIRWAIRSIVVFSNYIENFHRGEFVQSLLIEITAAMTVR